MTHPDQPHLQAIQDRFATKLTARLSDGSADLPYDISERLRAARMQALAKRKVLSAKMAPSIIGNGASASLTLGSDEPNRWNRLASVLPLMALVAGLLVIHFVQDDARAKEVAEVDAALLTDDLPTSAYTDPGFAEFLKSGWEATK